MLGLLGGILVIALVAVLVVVLMVAGMLAWGFRRTMTTVDDPAEDPAVKELKRRLAAGEISRDEYEYRRRELERHD